MGRHKPKVAGLEAIALQLLEFQKANNLSLDAVFNNLLRILKQIKKDQK